MKVKDLKKRLEQLDGELEVFIPYNTGIGNIAEVEQVKKSTYGFFGKSISCILLDKSE